MCIRDSVYKAFEDICEIPVREDAIYCNRIAGFDSYNTVLSLNLKTYCIYIKFGYKLIRYGHFNQQIYNPCTSLLNVQDKLGCLLQRLNVR